MEKVCSCKLTPLLSPSVVAKLYEAVMGSVDTADDS